VSCTFVRFCLAVHVLTREVQPGDAKGCACAVLLLCCAGVQQRIFVHDFQSVLTHGGPPQQQLDAPAAAAAAGSSAPPNTGGSSRSAGLDSALLPLLDLPCSSKVSCLSFSPTVQQYLLSSDYTGVVQLWDLTGEEALPATVFFLLPHSAHSSL
jgi:hypothetical protein